EVIRLLNSFGRTAEAAPLVNENRLALEQVVKEAPHSLGHQRYLAEVYFFLGDQQAKNGRRQEALGWWHRAYDGFKNAVEAQPANAAARFQLAYCCMEAARRHPDGPLVQEAEALLAHFGEGLVPLVREDPTSFLLRAELSAYCQLLLSLHEITGDR